MRSGGMMDAAGNYRFVPPHAAALRGESLTRAQTTNEIAPTETVRELARMESASTETRERRAGFAPRARIREIEIDPDTEALVFRSLDERTGRIVSQYPAEALLKLRAYVQASAEKKQDETALVERRA